MSARVIGCGTWLTGDQRTSLADITGQLPSSSGTSFPSQPNLVEPLAPEWPSWRQSFAFEFAWTKSTMRVHAATWAAFHIPVQPGLIRPSGETQVISVKTRPAPPSARSPRWTRWKSLGVPSTAEYIAIGETVTRFSTSISRILNGANIGGAVLLERPP